MSQIEIIFIRHGKAAGKWGDHPDPGLSDKGQLQADELLKHKELQNLGNYTFISSPKLRAIQTAGPLAKKFDKKISIDKTFIEIPSNTIEASMKQEWLKEIMECDKNNLPNPATIPALIVVSSSVSQRTSPDSIFMFETLPS